MKNLPLFWDWTPSDFWILFASVVVGALLIFGIYECRMSYAHPDKEVRFVVVDGHRFAIYEHSICEVTSQSLTNAQ